MNKYPFGRAPAPKRWNSKLFGVFDLETVGFGGKIIAAGFMVEGDITPTLTADPRQLVQAMFARSDVIWYAHNAGEFDLKHLHPYLLEYLKARGDEFKLSYRLQGITERCMGVAIQQGTDTVEIRDSYCLIPVSLKTMTASFSPAYIKRDRIDSFDVRPWEWSDPTDVEYLKYDVLGLLHSLREVSNLLWQSFSVPVRWTIGSTALLALQRSWPEDVLLWPPGVRVEEIARQAYVGGLVFPRDTNRITTPTIDLDVNSLYPFVMRGHDYPCGRVRGAFGKLHPDKLGIYEVTVATPDRDLVPIIPARLPNGRLVWPRGQFKTTLCSPTIEWAISAGYTIEIGSGVYWDDRCRPFDEFVDKVETLKTRGDPSIRMLAKMLGNSCSGKFGQHGEGRDVVYMSDRIEAFDLGYTPIRSSSGIPPEGMYERETHFYLPHSQPQIAAFITSYARLYLRELMDIVGDDAILYGDTDSLFIKYSRYLKVKNSLPMDPNKFGCLKAGKKITDLQIFASKSYALTRVDGTTEVKAKGIPVSLATAEGLRTQATVAWSSLASFSIGLRTGQLTKMSARTRTYPVGPSDEAWELVEGGKVRPLTLNLEDDELPPQH